MSIEPGWKTTEGCHVKSYFAPAERASPESIHRFTECVDEILLFAKALDSMPCPAVVLNKERQIVYANQRLLAVANAEQLEEVIGKRPGEVVGCIHANEGPGGCGTSEACAMCGAVNAIMECQKTGKMITRECRISVETGQSSALDLEVVATSFDMSVGPVTVCALRDISSEKRRQVLERVFFHDVLNTAGGIHGLVQLLVEDEVEPQGIIDEGNLKMLTSLTERLVHELREHRQLLFAETGELRAYPGVVSSQAILREVHALLSNHEIAKGRSLVMPIEHDTEIETDPDLLRRVLVNMAKNALEATPPGGTATVTCEDLGERMAFHVHNTAVMPLEVRLQVFNRSFSTKAGQGRGIGTYSMKLLGEKYLRGRVSFTSGEATGTTFTLEIPKEWGE